MYTQILQPPTPPPNEFTVVVQLREGPVTVTVRTSKLSRSPYYLYQVFKPDTPEPILELISWPSVADITDVLLGIKHGAARVYPQIKAPAFNNKPRVPPKKSVSV